MWAGGLFRLVFLRGFLGRPKRFHEGLFQVVTPIAIEFLSEWSYMWSDALSADDKAGRICFGDIAVTFREFP